jgi:predicted GIY-YIG superfamily endonuclease
MRGVYLLHLNTPMHHARHYLGYAADIDRRIQAHGTPTGARMLQVARERGITWQLARTWKHATRTDERHLKNQKNAPRLCPLCNPKTTKEIPNP